MKLNPRILFFILIPFVAWGILKDVSNTGNGGSIDLRNRITGARIASNGIDPYTYKWMRGEPEEFCDLFNASGDLLSSAFMMSLGVLPWNGRVRVSISYSMTPRV